MSDAVPIFMSDTAPRTSSCHGRTMTDRPIPRLVVLALLLVTPLLLSTGCASGSGNSDRAVAVAPETAEDQVRFGVEMARRGLWEEALFRFERAHRLAPNDARVLNNVAVAHEASGDYEKALEAYREALRLSPTDPELRRNYARFAEFYGSFRPAEEGGSDGLGLDLLAPGDGQNAESPEGDGEDDGGAEADTTGSDTTGSDTIGTQEVSP